ncbi:MAG TPA: FKBP-type peptidyl-prolyl cis-trans isomerase [Bacteroidia bacterium]|nr:FKBP-type peptidyl-prolyl cis-trans isomerase [Bacteroidia bacterium]
MYRFIVLLFVTLLFSCGEDPKPPAKKPLSKDQVNALSVQMNEWDETRQNDEINQYIKNHNWTMTETASGMRYMYMKKGTGEQAKQGEYAKVAYKIYLLDGTLCYSSEKDGPKEFLIGQDYVESGLHEAIQLMKIGDQMRIILPSHLAHGLTGDQSKIPALSSVMYEVELLSLRTK